MRRSGSGIVLLAGIMLLSIAESGLAAAEVVWRAGAQGVDEHVCDKVMREYVEKRYPKKVQAFRSRQQRDEREKRRQADARAREVQRYTVFFNGLMWQDAPAVLSRRYNWWEARSHCHELDFLGYRDWRLPTYAELMKAGIRFTRANLFRHIDRYGDFYWSSTAKGPYQSTACAVKFIKNYRSQYIGDCYAYKNSRYYVRCVR
jgi:hypothetical protein